MIACVDVDYRDAIAVAACVFFQHWADGTPVLESEIEINDVEPYEPGQFYRRELPCILAVLQTLPTLPQIVIIVHGNHRIPTMLKRVDQLSRGHLRSNNEE